LKLKAVIIGIGSQSKRIQKILDRLKIKFVIYYHKKNNDFNITLKELVDFNLIFICSPNNTHYFYTNYFKKSYIFCEKPPVNNKEDLKKIAKLNFKKIYFNYNFRFSNISKLISKSKEFNLGKLLYSNVIIGHGLASKKSYSKSWRANKTKTPKGVFEIVSIHIIDLFNFHFGIKSIHNTKLYNFSNKGNSIDTSSINFTLKNNAVVNIFTSYFCPFHEEWTLIFDNGIITYTDGKITIRGPRKNLNNKNNFIKPKIKFKQRISEIKDYENSLYESVKFFVNKANSKKFFDKKLFNISLESNKLILK
tara:strand:- start:2392 stop:3312 length:921 start_codon:yes stop_codon:yes gene_type:complete